MPLLFFGTRDDDRRPRLYGSNLRPIETSVFDSFKVSGLAPYRRRTDVALFWHLVELSHSAFAWHDRRGIEQVALIPQLLDQISVFAVLRTEFDVLPPALTFRISNDHRPYRYD